MEDKKDTEMEKEKSQEQHETQAPAAEEAAGPDKGSGSPGAESPKKEKAAKPKKKDETAALKEEIEDLKRQLDAQKDQYQRMLAEYANYKRRTEQEKAQLGSFVKAETLKALLPALDNLERAVDAPAGEEYKTGVDMTIRQLEELLASQGLEAIDRGVERVNLLDGRMEHALLLEFFSVAGVGTVMIRDEESLYARERGREKQEQTL